MIQRPARAFPRLFLAMVLFLAPFLAAVPTTLAAQDAATLLSPLKLANTSSPRDTFQSFVDSADALAREWEGARDDNRIFELVRTARETMDFRNADDGASISVQIEAILQLHDILARLELPDISEIPGRAEVQNQGVKDWVLPGSRIRIVRKQDGPQRGEFMFSADSVSRIDTDYHRVKSQPYQPGQRGIFQEYLHDPLSVSQINDDVSDLSQRLDTSSPRALLEAFLENVNEAYALAMETEALLEEEPPGITKQAALEEEAHALSYMARAAQGFDLTGTPVAFQSDVGVESALLLKEVLDRIMLPPIEYVPDRQLVESLRSGSGPFRWLIPGTAVEVIEVTEGQHAGRFLFSAATVKRLPDMYKQLRGLDYRELSMNDISAGYNSPQVSQNFYQSYISTPGSLVPSASFLGGVVHSLPDWFNVIHNGQTRWQWIGLTLSIAIAATISITVFRLADRSTMSQERPIRHWVLLSAPIISAFCVQVMARFANQTLNVTGRVLDVMIDTSTVIVLLLIAFAVWRLATAIAETIVASPRFAGRGVDISLIRIVARMLGIVAIVWVMMVGLRELGIDAVPLVAGLGVGGLAGALAIRPTLENLIGGLILFADKPVRVGDRCTVGEVTGHVETIGIRSTQIRGLDRSLVSIPNAKFADMEIVNWEHLDRMLIEQNIGLSTDTTASQMRQILTGTRAMLEKNARVDEEMSFVRLAGHETAALNLFARVYAITQDWEEFFEIREEVMLAISDIVEGAGAAFSADGG